MTLPDLFDDLVDIAGSVARASEGGFYQYLDVLVRSKPDASIAVLRRLRREFPKYGPRFTVLLAKQGDLLELPVAIETYNSSNHKPSLYASVQALGAFGDPKVIRKLEYRTGLDKGINMNILTILRQNGGDKDAFPFVEKYYFEFVKGRKALQHLDCVDAFEAIGDSRAIPYLREIIQTTERKQDAAYAIGRMMLPLRTKEPEDNYIDELSNCIHKVQNLETEVEERGAASTNPPGRPGSLHASHHEAWTSPRSVVWRVIFSLETGR